MKNIAVILAGGSGKRLGASIPKQFLKIDNKTIIELSIQAFHKNENIDEIVVIIHADFIKEVENIKNTGNYIKIKHILPGGKERSNSSLAAIKAYELDQEVNLIFHDAVRPFVSNKIINQVAAEVNQGKSVAVAIDTTDTIFQTNENNEIVDIPNRARIKRAQTPQAFPYKTIAKAYKLALGDPNFIATDDCGVVNKYLSDEKIMIVEGSEDNIKITFKEDLELGENIIIKQKTSE